MNKIKTTTLFCLLMIFFLTETKAQLPGGKLKQLSDAPTDSIPHEVVNADQVAYNTILLQWKTIAELNKWIKDNFSYSMERAKLLAENSLEREKTGIYSPAELYQVKKGVCIDLSRFAVETINSIDTSRHAQYLMIEFEPILIDSSIISKHWMATYHDSSGYYFFADSKRPGYTAGPYKNVDDFISEYQAFRERKIISWKILVSYQKKKMKKMIRQE